MIDVRITEDVLEPKMAEEFIADNRAGGTVVFIGTVRDATKGKKVVELTFESYVPMAEKEMMKIAAQAKEKWDCLKIAIHHRVGTLQVGEIPVVIAVSTQHRKAAFAACEYCIDTLKETVPIWKKEVFEDGDVWVAAHP